MKKMLSLILLGSLVMGASINADQNFWKDASSKWNIGWGLFSAGCAAYYQYKINQQQANNAYADKQILERISQTTNTHTAVNGLAASVAQLHISDGEKNALTQAIQRYDDAIANNDLAITVQRAEIVRNIVNTHLNTSNSTLNPHYANVAGRDAWLFSAGLASGLLFFNWCLHSN